MPISAKRALGGVVVIGAAVLMRPGLGWECAG